MLRHAFYAATYWLPVLLILLIVLARIAAPFPYGGTDYNQTIEESLITAAKERSDSGSLYVKVDGGDPSADVLADLNSRKLPATFAPWSLRPHSSYSCPPKTICDIVDGASLRDNFLSADLLSMPLWHVALVRVKGGACSAELTLLRGSQWHVLSQRTACT
jgi:hypothetical protein